MPHDNIEERVFRPLIKAIDNHLKGLPIHSVPETCDQRETLACLIDACMQRPHESAYAAILVSGTEHDACCAEGIDELLAQTGLRLIGTEYDFTPEAVKRVRTIFGYLLSVVHARTLDLSDPVGRDHVVDQLMEMLRADDDRETCTNKRLRLCVDA